MKKFGSAALAVGVLLMGMPTAAFAGWEDDVSNAIRAAQSYPRSAIRRGDEGDVTIRVFVGADGKVSNVELVEASGSDILDREALRMPAKAGNLPKHPSGSEGIVTIPLSFQLQ